MPYESQKLFIVQISDVANVNTKTLPLSYRYFSDMHL